MAVHPPVDDHLWPPTACHAVLGAWWVPGPGQGVGPTDARRRPASEQRPLGQEEQQPKRDALGGDAFASVFASVGRRLWAVGCTRREGTNVGQAAGLAASCLPACDAEWEAFKSGSLSFRALSFANGVSAYLPMLEYLGR